MSKREVIFLSCVALAVVIFLADHLISSAKTDDTQARQQVALVEKLVNEQQVLLGKAGLKKHELITLNRLLEDPPSNPFARQWVGIIADQKRISNFSSITPVLSYNGYIRYGDRMIALVNDEEYEVGDQIENLPLVICAISPEQIDVENPNAVFKSRLSIKILPMESDDE
ncbi:MAG: hypothetical protein H8E68_00120 [Kiritimatiellaeota bacterium]|nr:hypothetical protein [Kiritimatiellota bacterium]